MRTRGHARRLNIHLAEGPTIVGLRSGTLLDPKLVAELRAVAARTDIAQRVLTILEPGQGPKSPAAAGRHAPLIRDPPDADADASDGLECVRWYRSSGAFQRCDEYLSNELADNTTSRFLK
ncbi:MAG: hypothetical protein WAS51_17145 [Ilumatobacteraceae bacterium]